MCAEEAAQLHVQHLCVSGESAKGLPCAKHTCISVVELYVTYVILHARSNIVGEVAGLMAWYCLQMHAANFGCMSHHTTTREQTEVLQACKQCTMLILQPHLTDMFVHSYTHNDYISRPLRMVAGTSLKEGRGKVKLMKWNAQQLMMCSDMPLASCNHTVTANFGLTSNGITLINTTNIM